jgi:hypothetical protein
MSLGLACGDSLTEGSGTNSAGSEGVSEATRATASESESESESESAGPSGTASASGASDSGASDSDGTASGATDSATQGATDSATDSASGTQGGTETGGLTTSTSAGTGTGFGPDSCKRVDVVFAVDNSGSMSEEHAALIGPVFDAFPDALLDVGNGIEDFHLGVINACPKPGYLHNYGADGACDYSTGLNWMISSSPNLNDEYACVTDFTDSGWEDTPTMCVDSGIFGDDDEQPASTAAAVLAPDALAGANSGFLRSDALLLVIAITDEDEEAIDINGDPVSPADIAQQIIDAKGTVDEIVFMGVGGLSNCNGPYGSANKADNLQAVTQVFVDADRGMFWDICQGDLETAFEQVIKIVDSVCFEVVPE